MKSRNIVMKPLYIVSILRFSFVLYLLAPNLAAAAISEEATRIPYQVNNSDRIIIGTVSNIATYSDSTVFTIAVKEWLYNPLPTEAIKVRSRTGTNVWVEDEIELTQNESALLMLKDENLDQMLFRVPLGIKYPVSDRDAVIEALKAQGKWTEHDQTVNRTNDIGLTSNAGTAVKQEKKSNNSQKSNNIPFISPVWVLVVVLGAVICVKTKKH
jgi:hypothetical protein